MVRTAEFKGMMTEKAAADLRARGLPGPVFDEKVKGFRHAYRDASGLKLDLKPRQTNQFDIDIDLVP